jgi:hypothetical protein
LHFRRDVLSNGFSAHDGIVTRAEESFLSATRNPKNRCKTAKKSFLGEEILVDTYNSSSEFGRSSAPSTSHKKKGRKFIREFLFLGLGFQEFRLSSSVCFACCCIKLCFVNLTCNFSFAKKRKKKKTQHLM